VCDKFVENVINAFRRHKADSALVDVNPQICHTPYGQIIFLFFMFMEIAHKEFSVWSSFQK